MPKRKPDPDILLPDKVFKTGLFGLFRYYLATMVCIAHLAPWEYMSFGIYAVMAFFTLSGYLISLSYLTHYSKIQNGLIKFYSNRFMRVYPAFFVVFVASVLFAFAFPELALKAHQRYVLPDTISGWFHNLTLVGLTYPDGNRSAEIIVPPIWSLGIELTIWAFIPFFLRFRYLGATWVAFSLISFVYLAMPNHEFITRYYSILGNSICFVIGFLLCLYCEKIKRPDIPDLLPKLVLILYPLFYVFSLFIWSDMMVKLNTGMYVFLVINTLSIIILANTKRDPSNHFVNKLDDFLGDVSYPLFLCHILAGGLILLLLPGIGEARTIGFFILSFLMANILAVLLYLFVETRVKNIRKKLRN